MATKKSVKVALFLTWAANNELTIEKALSILSEADRLLRITSYSSYKEGIKKWKAEVKS